MRKIIAFILGLVEFRQSLTWSDPARTADNGYTVLDEAYDHGREWAHRLTFRRFEE